MLDNMRSDAYNEIKYRIIHFDYVPGQKISEKLISQELNLGRTPVREAIIRIEREGLIEVIPQSGTYITKIDMADAKNARFVRSCIEPKIMVDAAVNISDEAIATIQKNLDQQQQTALKNEPDNFFDLDQEFHHAFYKVLRLKETELDWDTLTNQHTAIFNAVKNKDIDDLSFLVTQHLHLMLLEKQKVVDAYPDYFKN